MDVSSPTYGGISFEHKKEMVQKLTDTMVSIEGENMRKITWVVIDEVIPIKDKYRPPSPVANNSSLMTNEMRASRSKSPGNYNG